MKMTTYPEFDRSTEATTVATALSSEIRGRNFIITGVSANGIGGATARALASQSPKLLVLTGRSEERVKPVMLEIHSKCSNVLCRFLELDLASQSSVRKAAAEVNSYDENINVLINNAGIAQLPERTLNETGIEMHFATNHIGHFLFTNLIKPKLLAAAKSASPAVSSRVINVASIAHVFGPVRFSDINFDKPKEEIPQDEWPDYELTKAWGRIDERYIPMSAYAQSKTANILFTVALNRRLQSQGIQSLAVNPGIVRTDGQRYASSEFRHSMEQALAGKWQTLEQSASPTLVAALDPAIKLEGSNVYMSECQFAVAKSYATNRAKAEELWSLSEHLLREKSGL